MKEALIEFIQSLPNGETGVRFFEMPTGSGKTYGAIQFMHDFIVNPEGFGIKRIIYLTNIKTNLNKAYSDLKESFKEGDERFDANVLKITANIDCVIDKILDVTVDDEITKLSSFQNLRSNVSLLKQLQELPDTTPETIESFRKSELGKSEKLFRSDLEKMLFKWNDCPKEIQRINKIKRKYPWLIDLYPAILTSQRPVLFITTDKFHAGNNPIVTKSYRFSSNSIIKDSLIILDESDKAKMHLLNHQIQNATDYQLDLLNVVCAIYKSFATDEKPEDLFKQAKPEEIEKTTLRAFEKTKKVFEDTFINHNLKYQFKLEDESEGKNFFIFHDFDPMTISSSKEVGSIYIRKDDKKKQNIITRVERKTNTDRLNSLIGDLVGSIKFFITFVSIAADNYMEARNKELKLDEQIEFEDAVSTVLSVFGIEQGSLETLKRIVINSSRRGTGKKVLKQKTELFGYDLYEEGFQLYSFLNDASYDLSTKIMMSFLDETPEKFLKTLASNTMVACVSATASMDTVLNNFNLRYLKDCLGDSMSFLPKPTVDRLKANYKKRREEANIKVDVESIDITTQELAESFAPSSAVEREQFEAILNSYPDASRKSKDPLYYKRVLVKTAIAVRKFVLNKDGHVMLVLTPRLLKMNSSGGIYNREVIENVIRIIDKKNHGKVCILTLSSKNYNYFKADYEKAISEGKKVIIFSSYSSAGTGQNLQYKVMDEAGIGIEVDIDSIYLEKPTYLLSIPERNMSEANLSELIYENLALATNREKTFREAKAFIKKACQVKEQDENDPDNMFGAYQNYECDSVNNAGIVIIKQAIGRISRTDDKHSFSKHKFIYIDQEIFNSFSFEEEKNKFNTAEFQEVVNKATAPKRNNPIVDSEMNYAINMCDVSRSNIKRLLQVDKDKWLESNVELYKRIRLFLLRHPTISEEELSKNPDMRMFYLKDPSGIKINSYWFQRTNEGDNYRIEKIAFEKFHKGVQACSAYVKLDDFMNVPEIKNYFTLPENQFATFFGRNDYIVLPNILDDIYRGILGEAVGYAIFQNKLHIELQEITDLTKFEKFDYCLKQDPDIYVDFKHWSRTRKDDDEELEKIAEKKRKIGAKAVFVINVMDYNSENKVYFYPKDKDIVVIPWLLVNSIFGPMFKESRCMAVKAAIEEVLR